MHRAKVPDFKVGSVVVLRRVKFVNTSVVDAVYACSTPGTAWIEASINLRDAVTGAREITWTEDDCKKLKSLRDWAVSFVCNSTKKVPNFEPYLWPIEGRTIEGHPFLRPLKLGESEVAQEEESTNYEIVKVPLMAGHDYKKGIVEPDRNLETEPSLKVGVA